MTAADLVAALERLPPSAPLLVLVNSGGGSVGDGLAIHNALVRRGGVVTRASSTVTVTVVDVAAVGVPHTVRSVAQFGRPSDRPAGSPAGV